MNDLDLFKAIEAELIAEGFGDEDPFGDNGYADEDEAYSDYPDGLDGFDEL